MSTSKHSKHHLTPSLPLPTPCELTYELPITTTQAAFIQQSRDEVQEILTGEDSRLLLIVGPCSIHDITAAKEYANKLRHLADSVSDTFCLIMRTYFEKPRTALGWKGFLYDPWLNGSHDIASGLRLTRQLLLDLADMKIPTAAEFLDPTSANYVGDLITWGCIGARTAASQTHRQMASGLPMPIAFKNSTDGNIDVAINGALSASHAHTYLGMNADGQASVIHTAGNGHTHIVLRGGEQKPNYDPESIAHALGSLQKAKLTPRLLIDCSHDNSFRQHQQQSIVFQSLLHQVVEGNHNICGTLIESHLFEGNQLLAGDPTKLKYAVSLTDPCLSWSATEQLILWGRDLLKRERKPSMQLQEASFKNFAVKEHCLLTPRSKFAPLPQYPV